jgi:cellulose synthase/poly-beta-1,6-N-acetylglucosamine synthase-like glycosyltransferase
MIEVVLLVILAPFALASAYLAALSVIALCRRERASAPASRPYRFLMVVPAHDEEERLPLLFAGLRDLDLSRHQLTVAVIADHSSDASATIALDAGALVFERSEGARSKGAAIEWLLARPEFRSIERDAVVFVDADCTVSPNLLAEFARSLEDGARVVQAYYNVSDAHGSASLELREIAFALVHLLRPLGRTAYGGTAGLKGTGMCFETRALDEIGWPSHGLAEDAEQHMRLLRLGYRVDFARRARVSGFMAKSLAGSASQHRRWESGRLHLMRESLSLLLRGVRSGSVATIDGAFEQMIPPLSVLVGALVAGFAVAAALGVSSAAMVAGATLVALAFYVMAGAWLLSPTPASLLRAASAAPVYITWKLWTYARALVVRPGAAWVRTPRDGAR